MRRVLALSLLSALAGAHVSAQSPRAIEEVFPASSFAFAQFGGLKACSEGARELGLVQLGEQAAERIGPEMFDHEMARQLMRELGRELGDLDSARVHKALRRLHHKLGEVGLEPAMLRAALQNPIAIGVGRPTFFGGAPVPSVALAIDTTGCEEEVQRLHRMMMGMVMQLGPVVERGSQQMHGAEVTVLTSPDHSGAVASTRVGKYLLISNSTGYLRECLAACSNSQLSLASQASYRAGRDKLPARSLLSGFVNVGPLCGAFAPLLPYEISDIFAALGTEKVDGFFFGVSTQDGGSLDIAHAAVHGPESGMLRSMLGRPASLAAAKLCPDDSVLFMTASLDPGSVIEAGDRLIDALPPEVGNEVRRELLGELERELRREGMSVAECEQLVRLFGPEMSLAVTMPIGSSLFPDVVAMLDVTDPEQARQLVGFLLDKMDGAQIRETEHHGTRIYYSNAVRKQAPYSPALAIHGDRILLGSSVQAMKGILARAEGKRASLADQEDFARHAASVQGASMFATARLQSAVPHLWRLAERVIEMGLARAEIDPDVLPTTEELAEGISDSVVSLTVDGEGMTMRSQNAVGMGGLVALAGMAVDELLGADVGGETHRDAQPKKSAAVRVH